MLSGPITGPLKMIVTGHENGNVTVEFEASDEDKKALSTTVIFGLLENAKDAIRAMSQQAQKQQQPTIQLARGGFPNGTVRR